MSDMYIGKAVEFMRGIEESEDYADIGMRARVTSAHFHLDPLDICDSYYVFTFNFLEFEEHNKPLETSSWYDDEYNPILTFRQCIGAEKINLGKYFFPLFPCNLESCYFFVLDNDRYYSEFIKLKLCEEKRVAAPLRRHLVSLRMILDGSN